MAEPVTSNQSDNSPLLEDETLSSHSDTDFNPEEALQCDPDAMLNEFSADSLTRDDEYSLALLFSILQQDIQLMVTPAATKYLHKTIEKWRVDFLHCELNGIESVRGHSKRITRSLCNYTLPSLHDTTSYIQRS